MGDSWTAESTQIERSDPHTLFAELLAVAIGKAPLQPSPMAIAYLVELLDERIRAHLPGPAGGESLAEALLAARQGCGINRIRSMRELGDHALFVSGFFGDSLARSAVDIDYYEDVGRNAYQDVAVGLRDQGAGPSWERLYAGLAQDFPGFVDLLAEVGDQSRPVPTADCRDTPPCHQPQARQSRLLRTYERYMRTGSPRDRRQLIRNGHLPSDREGVKRWQ
jgi:hypothetical protein